MWPHCLAFSHHKWSIIAIILTESPAPAYPMPGPRQSLYLAQPPIISGIVGCAYNVFKCLIQPISCLIMSPITHADVRRSTGRPKLVPGAYIGPYRPYSRHIWPCAASAGLTPTGQLHMDVETSFLAQSPYYYALAPSPCSGDSFKMGRTYHIGL